MDTNKTTTETIRIEHMNQDERRLVRSLSPSERKNILVEAAKERLAKSVKTKEKRT